VAWLLPRLAGIVDRAPTYPGFHRDDWESFQVRVDPDGEPWVRSSSHGHYQGCKWRDWPNRCKSNHRSANRSSKRYSAPLVAPAVEPCPRAQRPLRAGRRALWSRRLDAGRWRVSSPDGGRAPPSRARRPTPGSRGQDRRFSSRLSHKADSQQRQRAGGSARQSGRPPRARDGRLTRERGDGRFRSPPLEAIQGARQGFVRQPPSKAGVTKRTGRLSSSRERSTRALLEPSAAIARKE
jgi:hypothetical protein